jgi:zinc-finger binding domain of transposase IS66/Transposase C of IS166 homeodomain
MRKVVTVARFDLAKREALVEDSRMLSPLDPAALPGNVTALRTLLLAREDEHAAALEAARNGLKDQAIQIEQLKARLAKLLRHRFGSSSEKMRGAIEPLELIIGDLEEEIAEKAPSEPEPEPEPPTADPEIQPRRRKPKRKPLPETLPRDVVEHAPACACPKCGGALRRLGEDVTEVLEYVPGSFRVTRHVRPKMSCRCCESITQPPVPSLPSRLTALAWHQSASRPDPPRPRRSWFAGACARGGNFVITCRCTVRPRFSPEMASIWIAPPWLTGLGKARGCYVHWLTRLACT